MLLMRISGERRGIMCRGIRQSSLACIKGVLLLSKE